MPTPFKFILPPLTGAILAFLVMFGLVWSQTQPPATNPASQSVLTYGDR